jgi:hypothetical protein
VERGWHCLDPLGSCFALVDCCRLIFFDFPSFRLTDRLKLSQMTIRNQLALYSNGAGEMVVKVLVKLFKRRHLDISVSVAFPMKSVTFSWTWLSLEMR